MTVIPIHHPDAPTDSEPWVLARPFAALLRHLVDATGLPWRVIALATGVPTRTAGRILRGDCRKIRQCDALALLAARPASLLALSSTPTPAEPTIERARALVDAGVPLATLAELVGTDELQIRRIVIGSTDTVTVLTALTFAALLEVRDAHCAAAATFPKVAPRKHAAA